MLLMQNVLVQLLEVLGLQVVIHQLGDGTVARAFVGVAADSSLGLQTVTVCFERSAEVLVDSHGGSVVQTPHHGWIGNQQNGKAGAPPQHQVVQVLRNGCLLVLLLRILLDNTETAFMVAEFVLENLNACICRVDHHRSLAALDSCMHLFLGDE